VRSRYTAGPADATDPYGIRTATPEVAANTLICLINQATYLLGRQLASLDRSFLAEGGFTERLCQQRQARRRWAPPPGRGPREQ